MPKYQLKKSVSCPGCKASMSVPNTKNQPSRTFNCPKCGKPLLVKFRIEADPDCDTNPPGVQPTPEEAHTIMQHKQQGTILPPKDKWPPTPGTLMYGQQASRLHIGRNTCGRCPKASPPLVQHYFSTGNSVSKLHFDINVRERKDKTFCVTLTLHKDKVSFTAVDNLPLQYGDEVLLRDGSVIQAGHEIFRYTSQQ